MFIKIEIVFYNLLLVRKCLCTALLFISVRIHIMRGKTKHLFVPKLAQPNFYHQWADFVVSQLKPNYQNQQ